MVQDFLFRRAVENAARRPSRRHAHPALSPASTAFRIQLGFGLIAAVLLGGSNVGAAPGVDGCAQVRQ